MIGVAEVVINSLVKNEKVFLSINKSMKIFENKDLSTVIFNAVFESTIDTICVSPDGRFLLICLKSGMVHIFDIEYCTDSNCLFSK
ncbi:hypothetical protein NQ314_014015 [Rhamnusium bicolor]|uniref:KNTC1 N-terminal domain-containing protein n=1 Tax=Rhamnusium bicolor TaxID=1586634 RepID=A0AAV8X4D6_9CUCU|nr:hypothetical protein NQ314_014015 [Rhamnusium bicolor]